MPKQRALPLCKQKKPSGRKGQGGESKRGVIYARYSSHAQKDASIEQQVEECLKFAKDEGITIVETYADRAVSGKTDRRPNFQKMMKDAEKGGFGYVVAWKSNRMGRNMLQAMLNEERLNEMGIRVLYTEEDFDDTAAGRFALRSMMNVNQFYSENMAEDIRRGLRDNAENCMVTNGTLPFGYRKTPDLKYELDEPKDAIVREIFSRVACGEPFVDIANDLNARNIRTSRGNPWGKNSFHVLLTNERYTGTYIYGDIRVPGGIPRIVSDQLFYKVQEVLKTKKNPQGRHRVNGDYILTGKLFCGKCKSPMVGMSGTSHTNEKHYYYACQKKRTEKSCNKKNVQRDVIEEAVARAIKNYALQDEIIQWIADSTVEYFRKKEEESHVSILEDELAEAKRAAKNIMTAIEQGIITPTTKSRLLEVEERQAQLTAQIASERADIIVVNREDMIAGLEVFREGDITDKRFQAKLFDTFLVAVYLYDDDMKLIFSFSGDKNTLRLKLDAEMVEKSGANGAPEGSRKVSFEPPNARYTNTTSRIGLAVYRNVFALVVETDGYEGETRLQTKRATYKGIQAWVKERYGIHVSNLAISQTKELCGLAKTEYKGYGDAEGNSAPKLAAKKEAAIREAFIWFGLIKKEWWKEAILDLLLGWLFCISRCQVRREETLAWGQ